MIKINTRLKMLAIAIGVVGVTLPTVSSAVPYRAREVYYYDDAAHTNQVGYFISTCIGPILTDGNFTDFFVVVSDVPCEGNPHGH